MEHSISAINPTGESVALLASLFGFRPSLRAFGRDFEQGPGAIRQD
jgi:hypothetical protein